MTDYERQGTGYDPHAFGHEAVGRDRPSLNHEFNTILFGSAGYLVGAVHGRQYWTDQKQFALRFRGADAASQMARSIPVATVAQDYFDDAVDPAILR